MTHRIYYTDASILGFDATVVRTVEHEGRSAAVLDRTAFYPTSGGRRVVVETLDGWDAAGLKVMASAATAAARKCILIVLFSASLPVTAIIAKSKDMTTDTHTLLQALVARFGGRGGAMPELVQGGGLSASPAALVAATRDWIAGI
jgi:alanyl-tRNA synthetase